MEKRVFLAILLSLLILLGWQFFMNKQLGIEPRSAQTVSVRNQQIPQEQASSVHANKEASSGLYGFAMYKPEDAVYLENDRVKIRLDKCLGVITGVWHKAFNDEKGQYLCLLNLTKGIPGVLMLSDLTGAPYIDYTKGFEVERATSKTGQGDVITLKSVASNGLKIWKTFNLLKNKECLRCTIKIENAEQSRRFGFDVVGCVGFVPEDRMRRRWAQFEIKTDKIIKKGVSRIKPGLVSEGTVVEWAQFRTQYFSQIVRPLGSFFTKIWTQTYTGNGKDWAWLVFGGKSVTLGHGDVLEEELYIYVGPNDYDLIGSCGPGFEDIGLRGTFGSISKFLLRILRFFHAITHSWGLAIILLTVTVSLCLLPLTKRSIKSMKKMQMLQPKIEKIRAKYKSDPHRLNKEISELWKEHRVNPLGGCLPMLLQMPVFFMLYRLFMHAVQLKGARFLWIRDLAEADHFIKLPTTFPIIGQYINLLPILAAVCMIFQQSLISGAGKDPNQKAMAFVMPIVFGLIFYNFPAGFVLYFMVSSILTSIYQWYFVKKVSD